MAKLKTVQSNTFIDSESGELLGSNKHKIVVNEDKEFFMLYAGFINLIIKEDFTAEVKVLALLLRHMGHGKVMGINKAIKEMFCKDASISMATFERIFSFYLGKDVIQRMGRGAYMLNPNYAYSGGERLSKLKFYLEAKLK